MNLIHQSFIFTFYRWLLWPTELSEPLWDQLLQTQQVMTQNLTQGLLTFYTLSKCD